jgi:hypothetical protein
MKQSGNLRYYTTRFIRSPGTFRVTKWAGHVATYGRQGMHMVHKILCENFSENITQKAENGGVTRFLVKEAVSIENESNWLRIYPMAGFWYYRCQTFGVYFQS